MKTLPAEVAVGRRVQRKEPRPGFDDMEFGYTRYFGPPDDPDDPQVYLVEVPPDETLPPHFHTVDQFQLMVDGSGILARQQMQSGCIHYADAFQPYGPIVTGDKGLTFLTIRSSRDGGPFFVPRDSDKLPRQRPRRRNLVCNIESASRVVPTGDSLPLIAQEEDGVAAVRVTAGPGATIEVPIDRGGTQIWFVLDGSIVTPEGNELRPGSGISVDEDDHGEAAMRAGDGGVELVVAQFRRSSVETPSTS